MGSLAYTHWLIHVKMLGKCGHFLQLACDFRNISSIEAPLQNCFFVAGKKTVYHLKRKMRYTYIYMLKISVTPEIFELKTVIVTFE